MLSSVKRTNLIPKLDNSSKYIDNFHIFRLIVCYSHSLNLVPFMYVPY